MLPDPRRDPPRGGAPRGGQQIRWEAESFSPYQPVGDEPRTLFDGEPVLPHQRHSATSRAAVEVAQPTAAGNRARVLDALQTPATDDEGAERTGLHPNTYRPRRVELVRSGLVRRVGTGRSRAGHAAALWGVVDRDQRPTDGGAADLWKVVLDQRPAWMSRRALDRLIQEAAAANGGNGAKALQQVLSDLKAFQ